MKQSLATLLLLSEVSASGVEFDYTTNGADWPEAYPDCALTNQSPIDLISAPGAYETYAASEDQFTKTYTNQENVAVAWVGDTNKVTLDADTTNFFTSEVASSVYGANTQYNAAQFHFHSGSEHTIDGQRFDFEMHTVHLAEETLENFGYAAFGIIFSVNDFTAELTPDQV
jgi:carbonic anhydrase